MGCSATPARISPATRRAVLLMSLLELLSSVPESSLELVSLLLVLSVQELVSERFPHHRCRPQPIHAWSALLLRHSGIRFRRSHWTLRPYGVILDSVRYVNGLLYYQHYIYLGV